MPNTPLGFPYPALTDAPNGPAQIQALATAIDTYLRNLRQARQVARSTSATIPDNANTGIASWADGTTYSVGSIAYGAGLFTVPALITAPVLWDWSATGLWSGPAGSFKEQMLVLKNGSPVVEGEESERVSVSQTGQMTTSGPIVLTGGDTLQLAVFQNSGAPAAFTPLRFSLSLKA